MSSILEDIKDNLGVPASVDVYDKTLVGHINSVFGTLTQLGVGVPVGYQIEDGTQVWSEFITDRFMNPVKSYMYLRVRLLFDPPATGFAMASFERQVEELQYRLMVEADY